MRTALPVAFRHDSGHDPDRNLDVEAIWAYGFAHRTGPGHTGIPAYLGAGHAAEPAYLLRPVWALTAHCADKAGHPGYGSTPDTGSNPADRTAANTCWTLTSPRIRRPPLAASTSSDTTPGTSLTRRLISRTQRRHSGAATNTVITGAAGSAPMTRPLSSM